MINKQSDDYCQNSITPDQEEDESLTKKSSSKSEEKTNPLSDLIKVFTDPMKSSLMADNFLTYDIQRVKIELRSALVKNQLRESELDEIYKTRWCEYDLLEEILQHVITYIESVKVELHSSERLASLLKTYTMHLPGMLNENLEASFRRAEAKPDVTFMHRLNIGPLLEKCRSMRVMKHRAEEGKYKYDRATRSFKSIMDTLSLNQKTFWKLCKQYEDILNGYMRGRAKLERKLDSFVPEMKQLLLTSLHVLGSNCSQNSAHFKSLLELFSNLSLCWKMKGGFPALNEINE